MELEALDREAVEGGEDAADVVGAAGGKAQAEALRVASPTRALRGVARLRVREDQLERLFADARLEFVRPCPGRRCGPR